MVYDRFQVGGFVLHFRVSTAHSGTFRHIPAHRGTSGVDLIYHRATMVFSFQHAHTCPRSTLGVAAGNVGGEIGARARHRAAVTPTTV
jgi:hypothetical protein